MKVSIVNDIEFHVDEGIYSGILRHIKNMTIERKDVSIPDILPDGTKITALGLGFCKGGGVFGKISVSDNICKIHNFAFWAADVESIVWPSGCKTIPASCFSECTAKSISGLDAVQTVDSHAFENSRFEQLSWPEAVETVPVYCFFKCNIGQISNLDAVTAIKECAFCNCEINSVSWPSSCKVIPKECFAGSKVGSIQNLGNIFAIEKDAFSDFSSPNVLDLSASGVCYVNGKAFQNTKCKVIFPEDVI